VEHLVAKEALLADRPDVYFTTKPLELEQPTSVMESFVFPSFWTLMLKVAELPAATFVLTLWFWAVVL